MLASNLAQIRSLSLRKKSVVKELHFQVHLQFICDILAYLSITEEKHSLMLIYY